MPITTYDRPAQQPLIETYIPAPFQEYLALGAKKQDEAEKIQDATGKLVDLAVSVKARPGHEDFKKDWLNDILPKIEALSDKALKEDDYLGALRDTKRLAREIINDPTRQELDFSYKNYEEYLKKRQDLGPDKIADWRDKNRFWKGATDEGTINPYRFEGLPERQDYTKFFNEQMANLKPSGLLTVDGRTYSSYQVFGIDDKTGQITTVKEGMEGIALDWLRQVAATKAADPAVSEHIASVDYLSKTDSELGGKLFADKLLDKNGQVVTSQQLLEQSLTVAGMNQLGIKAEHIESLAYQPKWVFESQQDVFDLQSGRFVTTRETPASKIATEKQEFVNGQLKSSQPLSREEFEGSDIFERIMSAFYTTPEAKNYIRTTEEGKKAAYDKYVQTFIAKENTVKTAINFYRNLPGSGLSGLNDEQVYNLYANAVNDAGQVSYKTAKITGGKYDAMTNAAKTQLAGSNILWYDKDMPQGPQSWDAVTKLIGTPTKDLMSTFVISDFLPNDPDKDFAGGLLGNVLGKNGRRYNIVVSPDVEVNNAMMPYALATKFIEDPGYAAANFNKDVSLPSAWKYGNDYITKMRVHPILTSRVNSGGKKGQFDVLVELLTEDGRKVGKATPSQLRELGIQQASPYWRNRLGVSFQSK